MTHGVLWSARRGAVPIDRPLVMAILNATPDSFSDGGAPIDAARIRAAIAAGADILDVGGESTRPGHADVPAEEETSRVVPVIEAIRAVDADVLVSVDTRKAAVAHAALAAGADLVNDVSGLGDPAMADVVRDAGCSVVLMRHEDLRGEAVAACRDQLAALAARAVAAGIPRDRLIMDPGLGFGSPPGADPAANLALARGVAAWAGGLPALVGASRKRFIGTLTGESAPAQRVGGSVAVAVAAVLAGADVVRVHDVKETADAVRVAAAIRRCAH